MKLASSPEFFLTRSKSVLGQRIVPTSEVVREVEGWNEEKAIHQTGVVSRNWVSDGQTGDRMASQAACQLLETLDRVPPIAAIICSTTSPEEATPSIACKVSSGLTSFVSADHWHAFDVNAACSGFLYALSLAYDELQYRVNHSVLVLTAEVLSRNINPKDASTAFLFGDAATATLVTREQVCQESLCCRRPISRASPDANRSLHGSKASSGGFLSMEGIAVARQANKDMATVMMQASEVYGVPIETIENIVPHPGSKRILLSVARRLEIDESAFIHTLAQTGNTSSSSIPLAIDLLWDKIPAEKPLGFFAFGAGFTSAATVGKKTTKYSD